MVQFFGIGPTNSSYQRELNNILKLNPHIKNPNQIRAGTLLRLGVLRTQRPSAVAGSDILLPSEGFMCPIEKGPESFIINDIPAQDELDFWMLSWLAERSNYLTIPGSIALGAKGNLLSPGNLQYIDRISDYYADYKSGKITRRVYDYRRRTALNHLKNNIGPFDKWLFGDKTPHEAIRIARGGGVPATANIVKHSHRLKQMAAVGKMGGYVLAGVGVAASCMQIANTEDRVEKNEIFVETVASTTVGLVAGATVGLFLISNPVGWGTALVLAAGSAAAAYGSGKVARSTYTGNLQNVDLVSGLGVDSVCQQKR